MFDKKCKLCTSLDSEGINDCEKITFYIWKKAGKYYEKVFCEQADEEVNNVLETQIDEIQDHYYWKDATY